MELGLPQSRAPKHPRYDAIHRALLAGLLSNVGTKSEGYEYLGTRGVKFSIFPGSALFGSRPKWVVAGELVETAKLYGRTCGGVQPLWIERAAAHLVEKSHSGPRWDAKTGSVIADEKVALYGLVLIPARVVPYGAINPRVSREMFIHHALVLGEWRTEGVFFRHNSELVAEVERLEAKIRQRNLLADISTRYAFYDARVPQGVTNGAQFETWRREVERGDARVLYMKKEDLLRADAPPITPENYPDKLSDAGGGLKLPVTYTFEPGEVTDGLTLTVPVAALGQLRGERYEWLVPGMLEEKITAMLRALPGAMRRNFVPVPSWAKSAAEALLAEKEGMGDVSLRDALAGYLARMTGVEITGSDFMEGALPAYMRMSFKVMDDGGKVLGLSRELPVLQRKLARETAGTFATIYDRQFNRDGVTAWDFGELPESVTVQRFGMTIVAYPALVEHGEGVGLRLLPSKEGAEAAHRAGVRRLFRMEHRREVKRLAADIGGFERMALEYYSLGTSERLKEELVTLGVDRALFGDGETVPRNKGAYEVVAEKGAGRLWERMAQAAGVVGGILAEYHRVMVMLEEGVAAFGAAVADVKEQLAYVVPQGFLVRTPWVWLEQMARYMAGMRVRLEKLKAGGSHVVDRDYAGMGAVAPWQNKYLERKRAHGLVGVRDPELEVFRWMLEEYRVSLFAQELGTAVVVSERRMEKQWEKVRK